MELSMDYLKTLKDHHEANLWTYASALLQMQEAIFALEIDEKNPKALKALAGRALEVGKELKAVLNVLGENMEE